jgi:hypothetical protein
MKRNLIACGIAAVLLITTEASFALEKDVNPTNVKSKAAGKVVKNAGKSAAVGAVAGKITDEPGKGVAAGAAVLGTKKILDNDKKDTKKKNPLPDNKPEKGSKRR